MQVDIKKIGVQLYSVRNEVENDLPGVLVELAQMGYQGVEFFGRFPQQSLEIRTVLNDHGLHGTGYHVMLPWLNEDSLNETVEMLLELEIHDAIVAVLPDEYREDLEGWQRAADLMNNVEPILHRHGIRLGYHNHDMEFVPVGDAMPMDLLLERFSPKIFWELDTGQAARAGVDPLTLLNRHRGRQPFLHVREYSPERETVLLGEGVVNWKEVLAFCEQEPSIEWLIVEQEHSIDPPLAACRTCLETLRQYLGASVD